MEGIPRPTARALFSLDRGPTPIVEWIPYVDPCSTGVTQQFVRGPPDYGGLDAFSRTFPTARERRLVDRSAKGSPCANATFDPLQRNGVEVGEDAAT